MEKPDEVIAVPQLCGTCGHLHAGPMTDRRSLPACDTCACTTFRLHHDEVASAAAEQAADAADFPDGRLIGGDYVRGLRAVVAALEDNMHADQGWDAEPLLGVLQAGAGTPGPDGTRMGTVSAVPFDLHYAALLEQTGSVDVAAYMLADMAERAPSNFDLWRAAAGDLDPGSPVIAWWASYECWVHPPGSRGSANTDPRLRADEVHQLICVDLDERIHEVTRLRSSDHVDHSVDPLARYQRQVTGATPPAGVHLARADRDGLPPLVDALLRLMRVSRTEMSVRAATAGLGH